MLQEETYKPYSESSTPGIKNKDHSYYLKFLVDENVRLFLPTYTFLPSFSTENHESNSGDSKKSFKILRLQAK